jgi:transforming growth factor-beta-induced protein
VKRLFLKAAGVAAAGALLKACGGGGGSGGGDGPTGSLTLLQVVQQDGRFSSLLNAVERAGLTSQLAQSGANQTLFAPTNEAFSALESRVGGLSDGQLTDILNFHLTPQFLSAAALNDLGSRNGTAATRYSFGGDAAVLIFVSGGGQLNIWDGVGRTSITFGQTNVAASNGVLHVVNDVLLPRHVLTVSKMLRASIDSFSNFRAAMTGANIDELDGPGPYTVFVPSNDAPGAINVRRHVLARQLGSDAFPATTTAYATLSGATTRLTSGTSPPQVVNMRNVLATLTDSTSTLANVTDVDFFGSNGVIHVLDKVLA